MAVTVRLATLSGRELRTLHVELSWSRSDVLVAAGAFVIAEYRLLCRAREIAGDVTLGDAGVQSGDTLHIILDPRPPALAVAGCLPFPVVEVLSGDLTRRELALNDFPDIVNSAEFLPDGEHIVTACDDGTLTRWNCGTGANLRLATCREPVAALAVHPIGHCVAFLVGEREVRSVDALTGALFFRERDVSASLNFVQWTADGAYILTAGRGAALRVWRHRRRHSFYELEGHTRQVLAAATAPGGSRVGTASADGTLRVWALPDELAHRVCHSGLRAQMNAVAFVRGGGWIVGGSSEGDVLWWSVDVGDLLGRVRYGPGAVTCLAASAAFADVAVATALGTLGLLDGITMAPRATRVPQVQGLVDDFISSVAFRPGVPSLDALAAGGVDEDVMSWTEVVTDIASSSDGDDAALEMDVE